MPKPSFFFLKKNCTSFLVFITLHPWFAGVWTIFVSNLVMQSLAKSGRKLATSFWPQLGWNSYVLKSMISWAWKALGYVFIFLLGFLLSKGYIGLWSAVPFIICTSWKSKACDNDKHKFQNVYQHSFRFNSWWLCFLHPIFPLIS
jgi:hypothetical protein